MLPATKRNEAQIYTITQKNLEKNHAKYKKPVTKDHVLYDSIHVKVQTGKSIETERSVVAQG